MKTKNLILALLFVSLAFFSSCGPNTLNSKQEEPKTKGEAIPLVKLLNKLDKKSYLPTSIIEYKATASVEESEAYDLQLDFSVFKSDKYKLSLSFEKATSGMVCLGACQPFENKTSYTNEIELLADNEEDATLGKKKGATTSLATHINIPNPQVGQTYTNKFTLSLTPSHGGTPLVWTINLSIKTI